MVCVLSLSLRLTSVAGIPGIELLPLMEATPQAQVSAAKNAQTDTVLTEHPRPSIAQLLKLCGCLVRL